MLEIFLEVILFLILFYCLTLATLNEDIDTKHHVLVEKAEEQIRKRNKKKNSEAKSRSSSSGSYSNKRSDCAEVKRQKKPWTFSYENLFRNICKTEEQPYETSDVFQRFKKQLPSFMRFNLSRRIDEHKNNFTDKSVGSIHIEILEKTTNTTANLINSTIEFLTSENKKHTKTTKAKYCGKATRDRGVKYKDSLVYFTPSFHDKLERQLMDLIQTYWDHYVRDYLNTSRSTPHLVNSKSLSQSDVSEIHHQDLQGSRSNHLEISGNLKSIWSNLLEDVTTVMNCSSTEQENGSVFNCQENIEVSNNHQEDNNETSLHLQQSQRSNKETRPLKSIQSLLKKELEEILNNDDDKKSYPDPSNICVDVKTSFKKSLLETRLSQMNYHNYKNHDEGILRTTSYQALVDNLQFIANFIQKNCATPNDLECFEALNVSRSRFLLNRQLVKALRSKTSQNNKTIREDAQEGEITKILK